MRRGEQIMFNSAVCGFTDEPAQIDTQLPKVGADSATIIAELDLTESDREAILGSLNSNVRTTGKS
jgi:hypothetical protein